MKSKPTYFECHVTCAPETGEMLVSFEWHCAAWGFRPAKLLMKKGAQLEPSDLDMFCTTRGGQLEEVLHRMRGLVRDLRSAGLVVWRAKIEISILDEIYVSKSDRAAAATSLRKVYGAS